MNGLQAFWRGLARGARTGLVAGVLVIVAGTALAAWWLLRTDYQVLFADLKPQDAQAMTSELERLKIPYRLGDAGTSILVDKNTVHATRLKLMGRDLPLHGAVGLELFNNTDFGMTEFAQKINYQRALQGEITRTIQSLAEVRDVRVLLALPEQGLFKQATAKAKASITLTMRPGRTLRTEQVAGIQRLVAAAVPGMAMQDVTIVDSQGVALTRGDAGAEADGGGGRLDLKRDTEAYLARKVTEVLDRTFGTGQALASVDVSLNMDQVRVTTEDVLPAPTRAGLQSTGVVVREREVLRDGGAESKPADAGPLGRSGSQRDVEYAVGRRVEQVVSQPGSIRRIHVAVVVRTPLEGAQEDQLRRVLGAAAGASVDRGDTVVIQTLAGIAGTGPAPAPATAGAQAQAPVGEVGEAPLPSWLAEVRPLSALVAALLLVGLLAAVWALARRGQAEAGPRPVLSDAQRRAALQRVQGWMAEGRSGEGELR